MSTQDHHSGDADHDEVVKLESELAAVRAEVKRAMMQRGEASGDGRDDASRRVDELHTREEQIVRHIKDVKLRQTEELERQHKERKQRAKQAAARKGVSQPPVRREAPPRRGGLGQHPVADDEAEEAVERHWNEQDRLAAEEAEHNERVFEQARAADRVARQKAEEEQRRQREEDVRRKAQEEAARREAERKAAAAARKADSLRRKEETRAASLRRRASRREIEDRKAREQGAGRSWRTLLRQFWDGLLGR